jgi:hypothetical protein
MNINGKPLQIVASAAWNAQYGGLEAQLYTSEALKVLQEHPVDMLVFEMAGEGRMQIRSAGYLLPTDSPSDIEPVLDEDTIVMACESLEIKKFWFKLDDYGDKYVGTFLFPEDY